MDVAAVMDTVVETARVGVTARVAVIVARLAPTDLRAPRTTTVRSAASKSKVARRSASC
jgi:hypothetical protein